MSQVIRKFENSGKIEQSKPELFERRDVGKYNKTDVVSGLLKNIDTYAANNNLKGDELNAFRDGMGQFIEGVKNNTIIMNGDGSFRDTTGKIASTGKFDRNWIGKKKNTTNNTFNLVADYAQDYINKLPQYKEPAAKPKEKFKTNDFFNKGISMAWYGGNPVDKKNWFENRGANDRVALLTEIANTADYNKLFNEYDWTDTGIDSAETLGNRLKGFATALSDNKLDNEDYNSFATLGGSNLDEWFKQPAEQPEQPDLATKRKAALRQQAIDAGYTSEDAINAYIGKQQLEQDDKNQGLVDEFGNLKRRRATEAYFKEYQAKNPFTPSISGSYAGIKPNYSADAMDAYVRTNGGLRFNNILSKHSFTPDKGQHIVNNFDYLNKFYPTSLVDVGNGYKTVPTTYDYDKYTAIAFNPSNNSYKEVSMLANDMLKNLVYAHYENPNKTTSPQRPINQVRVGGGAGTKFQQGGVFDPELLRAGAIERYEAKEAAKREEAKQRAAASGKTPEQQKVADRVLSDTGWTGADYTRLGAIVADIGSMAAAYVPVYGTIASAGLGAGSSLANFGADWAQDGLDLKDFGNLAMNLGLDAVGLVPGFGSAAKGSKILKTAVKYLPRALSMLAVANYTGPAIDSMTKAIKGEKLTVEDWQNIAEGLKLTIQGGKGAKRTIQGKIMQNKLKTGNTLIDSTVKDGKPAKLTPDQLDDVRSKATREEQQAAIRELMGDDSFRLNKNLNKKWYNPVSWDNSKVRNEYDFNKTRTVRTSTGDKEVPIVYTTGDKFMAAAMQQNVWDLPGINNALLKYNDWKYGKAKSIKPVDTAKPTPAKPMLALPAPGQTNRVFRMGPTNTRGGDIIDATDPSKLRKPGTAERVVQPAPRDVKANAIVTSNTIPAAQRLDKFIENRIPGGRQFGNHRAKTEREYRDVFHPVVEKEYNSFWDAAIKGKKDFGYEDISPRRNIYTPPTGTEITYTPAPKRDEPTRFLYELQDNIQKNLGHNKREPIKKKSNEKPRKKTGNKRYVNKKLDGGIIFLQAGRAFPELKMAGLPYGPSELPDELPTRTPVLASSPAIPLGTEARRDVTPKKKKFNFKGVTEDLLALGRMGKGLATNEKAAKLYKESLKPTLLDTFENTVPLQGNFQAKAIAQQEANNLESMAAMPRTSDMSLQLAGSLEAGSRAGTIRQQGAMQDADRYYQTRMLGQQESDAAKARRVQVANQNRGSMNAVDAAKKQIDSAKLTSNYQQVVAPYMAGVENQFRQNSAMRKQFDMEQAQNTMSSEYDTAYADLLKKYKEDPTMLNQEVGKLRNRMSEDMINYKKRIFGSPWMFGRAPSSDIPYSAKGSKLSYKEKAMLQSAKDFNKRLSDDNKLMHRDIMEAKKEHNKLIMNMSSLTASLIKRGMNL